MPMIFKLIFLASMVAMVIVYPMYFLELSAFGKIVKRDHPDLLGRVDSSLATTYGILNKVKDGQLDGTILSPEAVLAHSRAKRLLYIGASLFLAVLFTGLWDAMISKHGW